MKTYEYTYPIENFSCYLKTQLSDYSDLSEKRRSHPIFLDIETSGLRRGNAIITLIGIAYYEENHLRIVQWFNDDAVSEEYLLRAFLEKIDALQGVLVSFNGNHFDLPFIKTHLSYNEISSLLLEDYPGIDLYPSLRYYGSLLPMSNQKQKSWEQLLGIVREDTLSGKEVVKYYKEYLKSKDEAYAQAVLCHNREDLHYLPYLLQFLSYEQIKKDSFSLYSVEEGPDGKNIIFHLKVTESFAYLFAATSRLGKVELIDDHTIRLTLSYYEDKMYHFYPDYKNYYYLLTEDRAIHKSIGSYVEAKHRIKACPENCYNSLDGLFLPQTVKARAYGFQIDGNEISHYPLYQRSYEDKDRFINFDDLFPGGMVNSNSLHYLGNIIQSILLQTIRERK